MKTRHTICLAVILALVAGSLSAQSLLDNQYYRKARNLRAESEQAMQEGDYETAERTAQEAKEYLVKSDEYVALMMRFYRAAGWLNKANARIGYAQSIKADKNYPEAFQSAKKDAASAKETLDSEQYEESVEFSQKALAALESIAEAAEKPAAASGILPKTYTVRLIRGRRDCFWRIAEYPFVYNDPRKWKKLYEANKESLNDPANPDLIEPGLVLTIPSIAGEEREGAWDPEATYPELKSK